MSVPLFREVLLRRDSDEPELPLEAEGVQRYVWESAFGDILIEIIGGSIYVNGDLVSLADNQPR